MTNSRRCGWGTVRRACTQVIVTVRVAIVCLGFLTLTVVLGNASHGAVVRNERLPSAAERAEVLQTLGNQPPLPLDFWVDDPCAGLWAFQDHHGAVVVGVSRYNGVLIAQFLLVDDFSESNVSADKIGPHTVRFDWDGKRYWMQCIGQNVNLETRRMTDPSGRAIALPIMSTDDIPQPDD